MVDSSRPPTIRYCGWNRGVSTRAENCEEANTITVSGRNAMPLASGE